MEARLTILVVEDSSDDQTLIRRAFDMAGGQLSLQIVKDGFEAIAYLKGNDCFADRTKFPYPSFILTDLKMSPLDGFEVLAWLREHSRLIPTMVFSGSQDLDDIKKSYQLGACGYLVKPQKFEIFCKLIKSLHDLWLCFELPAVDQEGKLMATASQGKLGERFTGGTKVQTGSGA